MTFNHRLIDFAVAVLLAAAVTIGSIDRAIPSLGKVTVHVEAFAAPKQQGRYTQSSSSGGGGRKKKSIGSNENWYNKRKAGIKVNSKGPKPPKWEKEGDELYVDFNIRSEGDDSSISKRLIGERDVTFEEAREILRSIEGPASSTQTKNAPGSKPPGDTVVSVCDDQPFMWGGLSVGPVWKSRLVQAGFASPTPIQVASYATLSNKKNQTSVNGNAVIAAATGSGKSLAYLLPFLTSIDTNNSKQKTKSHLQNDMNDGSFSAYDVTSALGRIWIVTPTMELAYQLQRTVDNIIVGKNDGRSTSKVLHVVEYNREGDKEPYSKEPYSFSASYPILTDIICRYYVIDSTTSQEPTFMAGTPKLFVQLRKEIKKVLTSTTRVDANLRYAKQRHARKLRETSEGMHIDEEYKSEEEKVDTEEQILYRRVALALRSNLQTLILDEVDRLLQTTTAMTRREHKTTRPLAQELLEALVWESTERIHPGAPTRRYRGNPVSPPVSKLQIVCASATIGRMLRRQLMYIVKAPSMDKAAVLITADVRTKKSAELRKASLLPSNLKHSYCLLENTETKDASAAEILRTLVSTLQMTQGMPEAPSLVFPGTIGVETVRDHLSDSGFRDIRGLSSLRSDVDSAEDDSSSSPMDIPVYVVKERLARGLDLPEIRKVILLGVPRNAAAYAHLAGRTARQNIPGDCIVLCKPSEAYRLVSIAKTLGLRNWRCLNEKNNNSVDTHPVEKRIANELSKKTNESIEENSWNLDSMTKTAIKGKNVSELRKFLESNGITTKGLLKDSLVDAVLRLRDNHSP